MPRARPPAAALGEADRLPAGRYLGSIGRRLDSGFALVSEVLHPVGRALPEHDHALDYFSMVVRGRYVETLAGRTLDYAPFQVGFHPARMPHRDRVGDCGARFLCLELRPQPLQAFASAIPFAPCLLPADATLPLVQVWRQLCADSLTPLVLDSLAWELCGPAPRRATMERPRARWLTRCLALIEDAYDEPWTVAGVAAAVGVHPVHLSREFRRRFRRTFGECLLRARVRAACRRIVESDESLASTAAQVGFADQSHFCRVFKAEVGCTPRAFAASVGRRA